MEIVIVVIVLFFGLIIAVGVVNFLVNASKPLIEQQARVVTKRQSTGGGGGNTSVSTYYYVTFEREDGTRIEFSIAGTDYGLLVEGDQGVLRSQGSWFKGFSRHIARR